MNFNLNNINYSCVPMYSNNDQLLAYTCSNKIMENFESSSNYNANTNYTPGAVVKYNNKIYFYKNTGEYVSGKTPNTNPAFWTVLENHENRSFQITNVYNKYDFVNVSNKLWQAKSNIPAGSGVNPNSWTNTIIKRWGIQKKYFLNDRVYFENKVYKVRDQVYPDGFMGIKPNENANVWMEVEWV
jgi:hypothetical protein